MFKMLIYFLQDHVVSQITLINGEKIWVREDKGPSWGNSNPSTSGSSCGSSDDCNSSTDSINICVPLFVSTSNQVSELDLSSEMLDLTTLLSSATPTSQLSQVTNCDTVQVIPSKPPQPSLVSRDRSSPDLPKPGNWMQCCLNTVWKFNVNSIMADFKRSILEFLNLDFCDNIIFRNFIDRKFKKLGYLNGQNGRFGGTEITKNLFHVKSEWQETSHNSTLQI